MVIFDLDHTLFTKDEVLHDHVAELLSILRQLGVHTAGLSAQDHRILVKLDEAGIRNYFVTILCSDQQIDPKAVAGVRHVLALVGAGPEHAVMVSNAQADILLGRKAGVGKTIGVTHGKADAAPFKEAGADHVVHDIPSVLDVLG